MLTRLVGAVRGAAMPQYERCDDHGSFSLYNGWALGAATSNCAFPTTSRIARGAQRKTLCDVFVMPAWLTAWRQGYEALAREGCGVVAKRGETQSRRPSILLLSWWRVVVGACYTGRSPALVPGGVCAARSQRVCQRGCSDTCGARCVTR